MKNLTFLVLFVAYCLCSLKADQFYFIKKCFRNDPAVNECIKSSANKFASYLPVGIPELDLLDVEPVFIDEISVALGNAFDRDGFRATFKNIKAFGVSNISLSKVDSNLDSYNFELTFEMPRIRVRSNFESSGVLILIRASGSGDYWGDYENVQSKVYIKFQPYNKMTDNRTYLSVENLQLDFSVRSIRMGVENDNSNKIIQAATNLFINSNAQELLKEMKPALREKLTILFYNFMENLFSKIPFDEWLE